MTAPAGPRFEGPAEVVQRRWALLAGAVVPLVAAVALARAGVPGWGVLVQEGIAVVLVGAFLSGAFLARRRGVLRADASGLALDDGTRVARSKIRSAYLASTDEPVVRVDRRRGPSLDARVESEEDARALVAALGFGPRESVVSVRAFYGDSGRFVLTMILLGVGVWGLMGGVLAHALLGRWSLLPWVLPCVVALVVVHARLVASVSIGADGVLLVRFGQRRFLSYGELEAASARGNVLVLEVSSGERIPLRVGPRAPAIAARIEEARAAFAEDLTHADALIGPAGRSLERWLRDLRTATKTRAYRDPQTASRDALARPRQRQPSPATRAGAALALSAGMDPPSRARLRVAAEACAEPKLRVALTRVAEGATDAELEEALAPLLEAKG